MEQISVDNLTEENLFHFTRTNNLESIRIEGIKPIIGDNAIGIEDTPKTFFSKGKLGVLKANEVWLRWLMNRIFGWNDRLGLYKYETKEERQKRMSKWTEEFLNKNYFNDTEKKEKLFEYFYKYTKERSYLVLLLEAEKDYRIDDEDENKVRLRNSDNEISQAFAKEMYGQFSNFESTVMDDWNMHTISGTHISPSNIKQVATPDGKTDMLSILMYIYEHNKDIPHNNFLLDDFIEYAKNKKTLEEMISEGDQKNDQNNYSRIY